MAPTSWSFPNWCWSATRRRIWCCGPHSSKPRPRRSTHWSRKARRDPRWSSRFRGVKAGCLHNAVALVADGRRQLRFKHELPNYGVFDEKRVFAAGPLPDSRSTFRGVRIGLPICEDIWFPTVVSASRAASALSCCWCRTARRSRSRSSHQRLDAGSRARQRDGAAAGLRESGRRPGRARVRRRLVRRQRRRRACASAAVLAGHRRADALASRGRRASMRGRGRLERAAAPRARSTTR